MKANFTKVLLFSAITFFFSGCFTLHNGYMSNSASLSSANFSYIKNDVKASETATYFLGIGGFKESLVAKAKEKLIAENPLQDNQALANITVNFKYSYYFLFITNTVECIISADIVQFYKLESEVNITDTISSRTAQVQSESLKKKEEMTLFEVGEKIKFYDKFSGNYINGIVTNIESNIFTIEYLDFKKKTKTVKIDRSTVRKLR